ncbi:unnamed protein product [Microthlaspi erraticum]|uniref:Retrotransposon gag domain-containing protein n=1 Tax=Microthlaspi erraticum TaxID=1685480 RepID=A0A6D2I6G7_9BRAS|nr:unnamed protein product [Microthlaspi erraticum]
MSSPQAPPPSWDSPPRLSSLKTKKKLLPYLEAADLETSSQAASYREEHLLATPEEEIDPELIEFVKRDQFHDLFSDTSLAGPALDWAQHEPPSTIESWIDFREAFLERFAKKPPFKSKYYHYSHQLEESVMKKNGEAYHPILKF